MFVPGQESLFGGDAVPQADGDFSSLRRAALDHGAWIDHAPGWLEGDGALYDDLAEQADWRQPEVKMYDRTVVTPRLVTTLQSGDHALLDGMTRLLSERYGIALDRISANWYRTGEDSVAWHGDRVARDRHSATVATVSLRGPRAFRFRPAAGGPSSMLSLGHGDLVVMGGTFQRTWRHSIPKATAPVPPRMVVMFRHAYD